MTSLPRDLRYPLAVHELKRWPSLMERKVNRCHDRSGRWRNEETGRETIEGAFFGDTAESGRKGRGGCAEKQGRKEIGQWKTGKGMEGPLSHGCR